MSLASGRAQLAFAFKSLSELWEQTQEKWRDVVRNDFAENHWRPLAGRVPEVLTAMDALDQVLAQMRHECGDDEGGF